MQCRPGGPWHPPHCDTKASAYMAQGTASAWDCTTPAALSACLAAVPCWHPNLEYRALTMLLTGSPCLKTKHSRNLEAGLEPCTVASSTCSAHPLLATSGPKALQRATYATCSTPCCALPFWQKPCVKRRVFQPSAQLLCLLLDLLCPNPEHTADNHSTLHKPHLCCLLLQLLCPGPEAVPLADQHPQHGMLPLVGPLCCLLSRHARRCCKSEPQVIGGQG